MKNKIIISVIIVFLAIIAGALYVINKPMKDNGLETSKKMAIGVIVGSTSQIDQYQAMIDHLNKNADHEWYLTRLKDYGSFITQMQIGQIQAGFAGSAIAYQMINNKVALPVVRGELNGISTYNGYIFSRKDSGINKIEDFKNKKFAYVDAYTTAGYFFPIYFLKSRGYDPDQFFRVTSFVGSHDKAIISVLDGEYDGGAAKDVAWKKMSKDNPKIESELQILEQDGPFPDNTFMISADLGESEVKELRDLFLSIGNTDKGKEALKKFGVDRFVVTEIGDFKNVKRIFDYLGKM